MLELSIQSTVLYGNLVWKTYIMYTGMHVANSVAVFGVFFGHFSYAELQFNKFYLPIFFALLVVRA